MLSMSTHVSRERAGSARIEPTSYLTQESDGVTSTIHTKNRFLGMRSP